MKKETKIGERLNKKREEDAINDKFEQVNKILSEIQNDTTKSKKEKVSHDVQILILHYLRIGNELDTNVDKAKLYAPLMNRDQEQTRQKLSYIDRFKKNKKNLHFLLNYFEELGFRDQISTIKEELDN